jgi:Glycosyl hydrolases family 8
MSGWLTAYSARTAALGAAAALAATLTGCASGQPPAPPAKDAAAAAFLSGYARPDGRVVRPDQGGDTVSEGQAYGLLLAGVAGDDAAFGRIWQWTRQHLQRGDGLFAYHADASGHVIGQQPASDADLLIAWALLRYQGTNTGAVHAAGRRVAAAVLAHEVTAGPQGMPILAAGPWATGRPATLNPSYWSLPALDGLAVLTGDGRWRRLAAAAVTLTRHVTAEGRLLPPDWVKLTADGQILPEPAPNGTAARQQYGLDAQRTVVWFAAACDPRVRALAARWWPRLSPDGRPQAIALSLDGTVVDGSAAVLPLVAAGAAADAAGDQASSGRMRSRAAEQQHDHPTYYGGAWAALGPALLPGGALRSC